MNHTTVGEIGTSMGLGVNALLLLGGAGFVAGVMNAVAGGGSFVTFPALVAAGLPSVGANASSTVALFPGQLTSAYAYRREIRSFQGLSMRVLVPLSLVGGICGALLLLFTPESTFDRVIPWLLLAGTIAFAFGPGLGPLLRRHLRIGARTLLVLQFGLAVYGGYFGGAVGLLMMGVWSVFGVSDVRAMSAARIALVTVMNSVAVVCFAMAGKVFWLPAATMGVASITGGYLGARLGRRMDPAKLRVVISCFNVAITIAFFWRAFRR
jgi:uncharacterized membrane protein YfcA